jgi:phosphoribosyl 1,2-cyclic phosphodiesterase
MTTQRRRTAGIHVRHDETNVHLDPGPGTLVFSNWAGLYPRNLDALIVSHCHLDHYSDAEVLIEAMTRGTTRNHGVLAATESVLYGYEGVGPSISSFHQNLVSDVILLEPGKKFQVNSIDFTVTEARHSDPTSVGLKFKAPDIGNIGYTGDTGYFPELADYYKDCKLLIMCVIWPRDNFIHKHLCTDDALKLLQDAKPKCSLITHFGMRMLNKSPEKEAEYLQEESGIPMIAAIDGMKIEVMGENIIFKGPRKKDEPLSFEI